MDTVNGNLIEICDHQPHASHEHMSMVSNIVGRIPIYYEEGEGPHAASQKGHSKKIHFEFTG